MMLRVNTYFFQMNMTCEIDIRCLSLGAGHREAEDPAERTAVDGP